MVPPDERTAQIANRFRDREAIRNLVESWALWRDAGDWVRLRSVWHHDGRIVTTWCQASADEFISSSRRAWDRGLDVLHFLSGSAIEIVDDRALCQTRMTIAQRDSVHGVLVDVVCAGRFYDFFERRAGRWGLVLRQGIYERDRMDVVAPGEAVRLDPELLSRFPHGYRHLAYLQTQNGFSVKPDMPGRKGPEIERLYAMGVGWLSGQT